MTCEQEKSKQSDFSPDPPGIVLSDEYIGRIAIAPEHYDVQNSTLKTAAFKVDELKGAGLSFTRLRFEAGPELEKTIKDLVRTRSENQFSGIFSACVGRIREIATDDGSQAFCIIDDGLSNYCSHCIITWHSSENAARSIVKKFRLQLMRRFDLYFPTTQSALEAFRT